VFISVHTAYGQRRKDFLHERLTKGTQVYKSLLLLSPQRIKWSVQKGPRQTDLPRSLVFCCFARHRAGEGEQRQPARENERPLDDRGYLPEQKPQAQMAAATSPGQEGSGDHPIAPAVDLER
jgi:hypothetical protein